MEVFQALVCCRSIVHMFPSQSSKQGLGNGNYKAERRKGISAEASSLAGELHPTQLKMQKAWLHWSENIEAFELS